MTDATPAGILVLSTLCRPRRTADAAVSRRRRDAERHGLSRTLGWPPEFPHAAIVSLPGRQRVGTGYEWFSVAGVTEENRPGRIADAMPEFAATVNAWQARTGVHAHATALIGFSQGAIMALESTRLEQALAVGRRAVRALRRSRGSRAAATTLHFIHGKQDSVIHYEHTVRAAERLISSGPT